MSSKELDLFKRLLKASDSSFTKSRELIFNALMNPEPQTMNQIIGKLKGKVDRVSVYRNIELFESIGAIRRINIGWKYKIELSDQFLAHHHHLNCLSCGKSIDIEDEVHINDFINKMALANGFKAKRHQFEIDGYCSNCQTAALQIA